MVKLRDLFNDRKQESDTALSQTPTKMTSDIKKKVFDDKLAIDVVDDSQMVTTTQVAKLRKKKGVETIIVDYK